MFWKEKDTIKGKCYVFSDYKQRNNVLSEYLEFKVPQDDYCW